MASIHREPGKPFWFASFRDATGRQWHRSTFTADKRAALRIANAWQQTADLAGAKTLTPDRARKVISDTARDVVELLPVVSRDDLKRVFLTCAELVSSPDGTRESIRVGIAKSVNAIAGAAGVEVPDATFEKWSERWLKAKESEATEGTHERYAACIGHARKYFAKTGKAKRPLSALTVDDVTGFRDDLATRLSAGSVNIALKVLRACLASAVKSEIVSRNVASAVSILKNSNGAGRRHFSENEVRKILTQCNNAGGEWRGLVLMALYTGQRLGDVAATTFQNIDFEANEIRFRTAKTGKFLELKMAAPLRAYLEELPSSDNPDDPVFPTAAELASIRTGTLSTKFYDEILAPAGLVPARPKDKSKILSGKGRGGRRAASPLSFHSFRHTLATWLRAAGASNAIAQAVLGHDSAEVAKNYTHLSADDSAAAIAALPDVTKETK